MKRYWITFCVMVCVMVGCQGNKSAETSDDVVADTTATVDSTSAKDEEIEVIESEPVPKAADELFDDFIFNFAANKRLQFSRIKFPLPVVRGDEVEMLPKSKWHMENFFMRQDFYTLIFDSESQLEEVKQMGITHAVVEKIYFHSKSIKQYVFDRVNGRWMLQKIVHMPIHESHNASFLEFYEHFAANPEFQSHHLNSTVDFVGPDPDDDFKQMEGVITPDTWQAFAPELPSDMIYNILYGKNPVAGKRKIFVLRGIANGLETELTFKQEGGKWILTKLST